MTSKDLETLQELLQKFSQSYHTCNNETNCSNCPYHMDCNDVLGTLAAVIEKKIFAKIEEEKKCSTI